MNVGKRLAMAEKILTEVYDSDEALLTVKESDFLASTLILLCKLELAVLKREAKEEAANHQYVINNQVPDIMKDVRGDLNDE